MTSLAHIKSVIRSPYAWPGGYPLFFVTADGACLSTLSARECWRQIVAAHLANDRRSGWFIVASDVNWEDPNLYCDHSGKRIESAYAEDDVT